MNLCIIPARGGSKRVPRKNIRLFHGRPMITYPIQAAIESGCFDLLIVSTDDDEIAEVARAHGATVPFKRPADLSDDYTATRPVVIHAIKEVERIYEKPEYVCCLYPAVPFIDSNDIRLAFEKLKTENVDFVFTATTFASPIQRAFRITPGGGVERIYPEHHLTRSQDLEVVYHDAGQFYLGRTQAFLEGKDSCSDASRLYVLPRHRVHDIDTLEDWDMAEAMYQVLENHQILR